MRAWLAVVVVWARWQSFRSEVSCVDDDVLELGVCPPLYVTNPMEAPTKKHTDLLEFCVN